MILVTPKSRDKFKAKKTFGELKVGDKYWTYLKSSGRIIERTIMKIKNNNHEFQSITEIGGQMAIDGDIIDVYYDNIHSDYRNSVYKGSSITIRSGASLIYATTKEELEEAIKYYS